MKTPVSTTAQRRRTLRNIRYAEVNMLPPGWDKGLEHQFGSTLIDPREDIAMGDEAGQHPISMDRPRISHRPMPIPTTRRDRLVALARWMATALVCTGLALTFIYHP